MEKQNIKGWPYILPGFIILALVIGVPLLYSFNYSLREVLIHRFDHQPFIGIDNFIRLFNDSYYWNSVRVTFIYSLSVTFISCILGFIVGLLVSNKKIKKQHWFITIFLIPFVVTPVVSATAWRFFLWEFEYGFVNFVLNIFGINNVPWLLRKNTAIIATIITNFWRLTPLALMIFYPALKNLPDSYLEAAKVDGASSIQMLTKIVIPIMRYHILFVILLVFTSTFRDFGAIRALTGGGPGRSTQVLSLFVHERGINLGQVGYGNAIAVTMFIMAGIGCLFYLRIFKRSLN